METQIGELLVPGQPKLDETTALSDVPKCEKDMLCTNVTKQKDSQCIHVTRQTERYTPCTNVVRQKDKSCTNVRRQNEKPCTNVTRWKDTSCTEFDVVLWISTGMNFLQPLVLADVLWWDHEEWMVNTNIKFPDSILKCSWIVSSPYVFLSSTQ